VDKPAILTVDDDPAVSAAVARDLRRKYGAQYQIYRATSGAEALDHLLVAARHHHLLEDVARQGALAPDDGDVDDRRQQTRGEIGCRRHHVIRHVARLVVRRLEGLVHAQREDRQAVEEEGVEMVGVEHHDDVGPRRGKLLLLHGEQLGGLAVRAVALDEMRKDRGVRDAEPADDLRHLELRLLGLGLT
jgi:CheY-like chemotaxis protein